MNNASADADDHASVQPYDMDKSPEEVQIDPERLARVLRELRSNKFPSIKEFAGLIGIDESTARRTEAAKTQPQLGTFLRWAVACQAPLDDLVERLGIALPVKDDLRQTYGTTTSALGRIHEPENRSVPASGLVRLVDIDREELRRLAQSIRVALDGISDAFDDFLATTTTPSAADEEPRPLPSPPANQAGGR